MTGSEGGGVNVNVSLDSFALEHTPTWAVAAVCVVFIAISMLMQRGLQRLGTWLLSSRKKSLYEALKKLKEELMLLGFISLLLTAAQNPMSRLCMPASSANEMLPCRFPKNSEIPAGPPSSHGIASTAVTLTPQSTAPISGVRRRSLHFTNHPNMHLKQPYLQQSDPDHRKILPSRSPAYHDESNRRVLSGMSSRHFCSPGHIPVLSTESLHQLHIFIFVMAVVHVFYSCFTMLFGITQLRSWRKWEEETNVDNYNYTDEIRKSFNDEAFSKIQFRKMGMGFGPLKRQSTFVTSRTMTPWSTSVYGIWFNSFFRQFGKSVAKSDYLTLRLGFIKNHNAPMHLNFHQYIMSSLQDDLKTVIGISGYLWVFVIVFMILNVHGWYAYFWMSFIPVLINLVIGTKLQNIITQLAMETAHEHGILAAPIKPRDELFWFNNPHLLLYLIHFVLFQNAFELAFCIWLMTTFGFNSCFFDKHGFITARVIVGILAQVLCSYSTLPLYALVSQMGSHYKKAIFADPVSNAVTDWRNKAKANIRHLRQNTPRDYHSRDFEHHAQSGTASQFESNYHGRKIDNPRANHCNCGSSLMVISSDKDPSQPETGTALYRRANSSTSLATGAEIGRVPEWCAKCCVECKRLSLSRCMDDSDMNKSEDQDYLGPNDTGEGSAHSQNARSLGSCQPKQILMKISNDDTTDGNPHVSLDCSECASLRTCREDTKLFRTQQEEGQQPLPDEQETATGVDPETFPRTCHNKKKPLFLRMLSAGIESKSEPLGPINESQKAKSFPRSSSTGMARVRSKDIAEPKAANHLQDINAFKADLMCSVSMNQSKEPFEMENHFADKFSTETARSSTMTRVEKLDKRATFSGRLLATSPSRERILQQGKLLHKSASFTARVPATLHGESVPTGAVSQKSSSPATIPTAGKGF